MLTSWLKLQIFLRNWAPDKFIWLRFPSRCWLLNSLSSKQCDLYPLGGCHIETGFRKGKYWRSLLKCYTFTGLLLRTHFWLKLNLQMPPDPLISHKWYPQLFCPLVPKNKPRNKKVIFPYPFLILFSNPPKSNLSEVTLITPFTWRLNVIVHSCRERLIEATYPLPKVAYFVVKPSIFKQKEVSRTSSP